jgi:hypothetical protein
MRNTIAYFLVLLFTFCFQNAKSQTNAFDLDKISIGDLNHDKIIDTAFVKGPKYINEKEFWGDCKNGNCAITISFSCHFPSITLKNAVTGFVENIGDIDNDGIAEIIIVPSWFIGCWGQINFYTLKKGKWKAVGSAKRNICGDESFMNYIKKMKGNKIQVIEQIWVDGDVVEKPKIIVIK